MAMSGVQLSPECQTAYISIQKDKKHRYIIFKIDNGQIVVEKYGARENNYDQFLSELQVKDGDHDDCRYAVFDYEYKSEAEGTDAVTLKKKLFLMSWCPDTAKIKKKMVYSSSFDNLKKAFHGVHKVLQANGEDEIEQKYVEEALRATDRK